jgi:hypothetical protein
MALLQLAQLLINLSIMLKVGMQLCVLTEDLPCMQTKLGNCISGHIYVLMSQCLMVKCLSVEMSFWAIVLGAVYMCVISCVICMQIAYKITFGFAC